MHAQADCLQEAIAEALLEARRSARGDVLKVTNAFINRHTEARCPRRRGAYQTFIRLLTAPEATELPSGVSIGREAIRLGSEEWRVLCYGNNGERDASVVLVRVGSRAFEELVELARLTRDVRKLLEDSKDGGDFLWEVADYMEMSQRALDGDEFAMKYLQHLWVRWGVRARMLAIASVLVEADPSLAGRLGLPWAGQGFRAAPVLIPINAVDVATLCLTRAKPAGWLWW